MNNPLSYVDPLGLDNDCGGPCTPFAYSDGNCIVNVTYHTETGQDGNSYDIPDVERNCFSDRPQGGNFPSGAGGIRPGLNPNLFKNGKWQCTKTGNGGWVCVGATAANNGNNNDVPLNPNAQKIFSQVYRQAAPIGNPCFWGAWAVGATAAGAGGTAAANGTEIATTVAENYPTWFGKAVNWLFRKVYNPGPVGVVGAGVRATWTQVNSTCSQLQ